MINNRQREDWFDTWLEARLGDGTTPPIGEDALDPRDAEAAHFATDGAGRFHAMASRAERHDHNPIERRQIWEQVLAGQAQERKRFGGGGGLRQVRPSWSAIASTMVAAMLVLAIVAGFRKFDFGREENDSLPSESTQYGLVIPRVDGDRPWNFVITETTCDVEPLSREELLKSLGYPADEAMPRSLETLPEEMRTIAPEKMPELVEVADLFFACLREGRPMSALSLTTSGFRQEWVMNHIVTTYGAASDEEVLAYVDQLVRAERGEIGIIRAPGSNVFLPAFDSNAWVQTTDKRLHLLVNWQSAQVNAEMSAYLVRPPTTIVFDNREIGLWRIDRLGTDPVGG
jgi:hypothetical protein